MKPYPSYTCVNLEWVPELPSGWTRTRLRDISKVPITNGTGAPGEFEDPAWARYIRITDIKDSRTLRSDVFKSQPPHVAIGYEVKKGDILFAAVGATYGKSYLHCLDGDYCYAGYLVRLRCDESVLPEFLSYWTESSQYWAQVNSRVIQSTIQNFSASKYKDLSFGKPPLVDQRAIVTFLDHETARIDSLIAEQRTLIGWLHEKRLAEITRAATEGIRPAAKFKGSGGPWFDSVPTHWEIKQIRHITLRLEQGWSPQAEDREAELDEWAVIKLSAIKQGRFIDKEHKALPANIVIPETLEIQPGDLLFTRANTPELVGDVCVVGETRSRLLFSDLVFRPRLDPDQVDARFLMYFLLSLSGRAQIECTARGSSQSMVKISQGMINSWQIPLPPLAEQKEIAARLDRDTDILDSLIAETETSIAFLQEHRSALITAVITGKVDVRDIMKEPA